MVTMDTGVEIMSRDMRIPTMWQFDMCRLGRACVAFLSVETPNDVQSVDEQRL